MTWFCRANTCLVADCGAALSQTLSTGRNLISAPVETIWWKKINPPKGICERKVSSDLDGLYHEGISSSKRRWLRKAICDQNVKTSWSRSAYVLFVSITWKLFSFEHFLQFAVFFLMCSLCHTVVLSAYSTGFVKELKVIFQAEPGKPNKTSCKGNKSENVFIKALWNMFVQVWLFQPQ